MAGLRGTQLMGSIIYTLVTIILEAIANHETWIDMLFWMPSSCNAIIVLQRLPLMTRIAMGEGPPVEFEANGHTYNSTLPMASIRGNTHEASRFRLPNSGGVML
jgi:hypothetical protein